MKHLENPAEQSIRSARRRGRPLSRCGVLLAIASFGIAACGDDEATAPAATEPVSTADGESYPTAELTIRHQAPQADVDVTYTLMCGPDAVVLGDDVDVDAQSACEALDDPAVVDRLVAGAPEDQICTEQFGGDDIATIIGTIGTTGTTGAIESENVDTTVDRVNGCGISTWDDLLAPVLPPAVGVQ